MNDTGHTVTMMTSTDELVAKQNISGATSLIEYHSAGHCLIVGTATEALQIAPKLTGLGVTVVSIEPGHGRIEKQLTDNGIAVFTVQSLELSGHLGAFVAIARASGNESNLAVSVYRESGAFDLVLDLSDQPLITNELAPFGYFAATDEAERHAAIDALPELVGEFEKPKYFNYNPSICAHSRSQLTGCNQCIDVCATGAIRSMGEGVEVNPYLCQGCGSCATVCPSGAMTYAYPAPKDAIQRTRDMLAETPASTLILHAETHQTEIDALQKPAGVLPLLVEEVSAFGMDYWATMLCSGVQRIVLVCRTEKSSSSYAALVAQSEIFHQLLSGIGVSDRVISLIDPEALPAFDLSSPVKSELSRLRSTGFATHNDKRQTLRQAFDVLVGQLQADAGIQTLQGGAPFGRIVVDDAACTLCMACVSTCPAKSLLDGQDSPALRQIEANCLQCGLCEQACPESAITLEPRYNYDSLAARRIETLKEETPFHCVRCHKAFATTGMIDTMMAKLKGHWMFTDEKSMRRLKMCEECRVKDIFEASRDGIDVHRGAGKSDA